MRLILTLIVLLVLVAGGFGAARWFLGGDSAAPVTFRLATVSRGDVVATIAATGTVVPEETVDIGAQVAGMIASFGLDKDGKVVDFGSRIGAGDVLAKIDDALYAAEASSAQAQMDQAQASVLVAQANLDHARANVGQAEAGVDVAMASASQAQARLTQAEADWKRAQELGSTGAISRTEFDQFRSSYDQARAAVDQVRASVRQAQAAVEQSRASLRVSEANVTQAQADVARARASVERAQRNLAFCTIRSPVDGVIIDRRVNIGQTVVSSLNAPSLFLIARDLTRMQVLAPVNEADIGAIKPGQPARFTVDARPGETFEGTVARVRLNAQMTQNVVTYMVEVTADNSSGRLLPYLTANVRFEVGRRNDVLRVPAAALRWQPRPELIADGGQEVRPATGAALTTRRGSTPGRGPAALETLWVQAGSLVRPLAVRAGLSDGQWTEVFAEDVREGMELVLGEEVQVTAAAGGSNPFMPSFGRGARGGGGGGAGAGRGR